MMTSSLSLLYFPTAVALGALHAVEPGHAKTLTAAYLIGIRGRKRDAVLLGLSVSATHSVVVVLISVIGLWLGREAFADQAMRWLQLGSGALVILLGSWMLWRRWPRKPKHSHSHSHEHAHTHSHAHAHEHPHPHDTHEHDHADLAEDEHMRAHAATMPQYVQEGQRPSIGQIMAFGAAGGMIPCPASVTVMLLALSASETALGFFMVVGFSLGLAITLVGMGLVVVLSIGRLSRGSSRFAMLSRNAPLLSAAIVVLSGIAALALAMA